MSLDIRALENAGKAVEEQRSNLQSLLEKRGQIFYQQKECELVQEEMGHFDESDVVMKQCGPALVARDLDQARDEIGQYLGAVTSQLASIDKAIADSQKALQQAEEKLRSMQVH